MSLPDSGLWLGWAQDLAPLLPVPDYLPALRRVGWALVLAAVVSLVAQSSVPRPARAVLRPLAGVLALWACVPGSWGLSYWLGLAFQTPSLMAIVLSLQVLGKSLAHGMRPQWALDSGYTSSRQRGPCWTCRYALLGLVVGWLLLLDTFAYLPLSLYAWGFSPLALALLWLLAMGPWVLGGQWSQSAPAPALLVALAWFALTRWPTGNVWDALLDPWLFLGLHLYLVVRYRGDRRD